MLQTNSGDSEAVIASLPDVQSGQIERLRARAKCAWYWITECAPEEFRFSLRNDDSKADLTPEEAAAIIAIRDTILPDMDTIDEKTLSQRIYAVAEEVGLEQKDLFTAVYRALIDKDRGPRLASFMKIIGSERLRVIFSNY